MLTNVKQQKMPNTIITSNIITRLEQIIEPWKSDEIFVLTDTNTRELCLPKLHESEKIRHSHNVTIPAGDDNGDRIRLQGEGEAGPPGAAAGDLFVEVNVREHRIFQRDGDDLYCEVPIRFSQAALGADLVVPTLDGEALIKVPLETQTGKLFRLRGKGVKSVRSHAPGDLLCRVVVETPVNLTSKQRELLRDFEATFQGEEGAKHSPRSSGFLDGVKAFWDRMTS